MKTEPKETQTFVSASGNLLSGSLSLSLFVSQGGWRQKKKARGGQWKRKVSFPIFHRPFLFFFNIANFSGILNRVKKSALIFRIEDRITQKRIIVS